MSEIAWEQVSFDDFELITLYLVEAMGFDDPRRVSGSGDEGQDIVAFQPPHLPGIRLRAREWVFQCKKVKTLKKSEITDELANFDSKKIDTWMLVTTYEPSPNFKRWFDTLDQSQKYPFHIQAWWRNDVESYIRKHSSHLKKCLPDTIVNKANRFDNYIGFLLSFYGEERLRARHPKFDWDLNFYSERPDLWKLLNIYHDPDASLTTIGLNSCDYETHQDHYGFIGGRQMRAIEDLLEDHETSGDAIRVALFHHHLHPFPELVELDGNTDPWVDISIIRDSGIIERQLERLKFDLILHGHKHKPQLRETTIRNLDDSNSDSKKLIVCGAGSVGVNSAELEHNISNQYQVVEILRTPRRKGVDFLRVEWRKLDVTPEAEWVTSGNWIVTG